VISDLDESMSGDEDGEFLVRGDPGTLYAATSGWEPSGHFLRVMELAETGEGRLIYQNLTAESAAGLKLRALKYMGSQRLFGLAESFGGTNGWGLIFELVPGGTNHPPSVVRRMESQIGMVGQPLALDIPESLFSDPDPGQSLRITVEGHPHGVLPPGVVVDPVTHRLSGIPQSSGITTVLVRATDNGTPPLTASLSFALTVEPALRFEKATSRWTSDWFEAVIRGPAGRRAQLEGSTDFSTWVPVNVVELNNQPQQVRDNVAGARPARRFYRLRLIP